MAGGWWSHQCNVSSKFKFENGDRVVLPRLILKAPSGND